MPQEILFFTQNFTIMNNNQNENNDNVKSIHDFDFNIICEYFSCLDRQGPGSDMMTRKALNAVPALVRDVSWLTWAAVRAVRRCNYCMAQRRW